MKEIDMLANNPPGTIKEYLDSRFESLADNMQILRNRVTSIEKFVSMPTATVAPTYTVHSLLQLNPISNFYEEINMTNSTPNQTKALTPHKWAEVIKAWADGKEIENKNTAYRNGEWYLVPTDEYRDFNNSNYEWRIKPEVQEGWINIYPNTVGDMYPTKEMADERASIRRVACIPIRYTPGEGL